MAAEFRLGVQSYCFRKFEAPGPLTEALGGLGFRYVELFPGHFSVERATDEQVAELERYRAAGIAVDSYGVCRFGEDEAAARRILAFCKLAGIRAVSADPDPGALDLCQRLADEYDVNLAVHNHGRKHRYGSVEQLDDLFGRTGPRIGLCLDTAWLIDAGGDPVAAADRYAERLYGVHLKDFAYDTGDETGDSRRDVIIGTGNLDLPAFVGKLAEVGFGGYMSLEYEGNPDDPSDEVRQCLDAVRAAMPAA